MYKSATPLKFNRISIAGLINIYVIIKCCLIKKNETALLQIVINK